MSINTAILVNGILDLGIVLAVAATMLVPFTLDRRKDEAALYALQRPSRTTSPRSAARSASALSQRSLR